MPRGTGKLAPCTVFFILAAAFLGIFWPACARGQHITAGSSHASYQSGLALLRWSMERSASLRTYRAVCDWTMSFGKGAAATTAVRYLAVARPKRFKIVARLSDRQVMTCVCDGTRLVEYSNRHPRPVFYPAPATPAAATSLQMGHPMFCGSLLYRFFQGPGALSHVVDLRRGRPVVGPEVIVDGAVCRTVRFYAVGAYGTTEVAIALKDGLVRRIRYNSEPLLALVRKDLKGNVPVISQTTEVYRSVAPNVQIAENVFATPSGGVARVAARAHITPAEKRLAPPQSRAARNGGEPKALPSLPPLASGPRFSSLVPPAPPSAAKAGPSAVAASLGPLPPPVWLPYASQPPRLPLNRPAPAFLLVSPDGSQVGLANVRGKVVLLTFWATWEPRCAEWLARLQALVKRLDEPRLAVLPVAHQPRAKVEEFARGHGISLPLYTDPGRAAGLAYRVPIVPTTAVLDAKGILRAYIIGMPSEAALRQELEKAGLYEGDAQP